MALDLRVGDDFPGESLPRDPRHVRRFVVAGPAGVAEVPGRAGVAPAGHVRIGAGPHVVGYLSRPTWTELPADRFEAYLFEAGLDAVVAERAARGESAAPGRERFVRCAKALVAGGGAPAQDAALRFPFELRAERLPAAGDPTVAVRAVFKGRPLARVLLRALSPRTAGPLVVLADATGRARIGPLGPGPWVIAATHMVRLRHDARADWGSFWASLAFAVPPGDAARE